MLDLMTPRRRSEESVSLLGTASGTLALKVCGGSHRGRVVQLRAPKCTIGSAAGCTLRLRATGVRPLHCWILRGPEGTVVRRCASGTLLNGQAYEDAPLRRGDRLRVGMVELEVVDCPERPAEYLLATMTQRMPIADASDDGKLRELEQRLTAANDEIARLEADAQQAWQTSITAAERAEQLRLALENANVEAGEVRGELEAAQAALASERLLRQQQPQAAELERKLVAAEQQLATSSDLQSSSARELAEQAARFASERDSLENQLEQLRRDVEQARAQSGQQAAQMTITMDQVRAETQAADAQQWQERCAAVECELQRTREELTAAANQAREAAGQWEGRYQEADRQVEHWQAEAQGQQTYIEELQQQLAAEKSRQAQVDAEALRQVENERRELSEQRADLSAREEQFAAAHRRLSELEAELKCGRDALEAERSQQQAGLDEQAEQVHQRVADLEGQAQLFIARQSAQEQMREQLAQEMAACEERALQVSAREAELAVRANELTATEAELQRERERLRQSADDLQARLDEFERRQEGERGAAHSNEVPVVGHGETISTGDSHDMHEMDSVLSRLVQSGRWRDATGAIVETPSGELPEAFTQSDLGSHASAGVESPLGSEPRVNDAREEPLAGLEECQRAAKRSTPGSDAEEGQEEESIEKYMERLMQRVRGDFTSAPHPAAMPALQQQLDESASAAPDEIQFPAEAEPVKPEEYLPRSQAPELSSGLAAMREVANTAARTAIEQHHQKSGNKQVAFKLFGAGVLLLGSALLGFWAWQMSSVTAAVGAGIGLLTGSLWALRGFVRLLHSVKLSRPPVVTEDPVPAQFAAAEMTDAAEQATEAEAPAVP